MSVEKEEANLYFWYIGHNRRAFASSAARKAAPDVTLTVDGKEVTVPAGMGRLFLAILGGNFLNFNV
jgi:hypothetical protein